MRLTTALVIVIFAFLFVIILTPKAKSVIRKEQENQTEFDKILGG